MLSRRTAIHALLAVAFTAPLAAQQAPATDEARFQRLSPLLELHPAFPERTSVMWTEVVTSEYARVRIWERGAGETLACGTGACAVAVAGYVNGRTGPRVAVESRGGTLTIEVGENLSLRMTGPAARVYEGRWLG